MAQKDKSIRLWNLAVLLQLLANYPRSNRQDQPTHPFHLTHHATFTFFCHTKLFLKLRLSQTAQQEHNLLVALLGPFDYERFYCILLLLLYDKLLSRLYMECIHDLRHRQT